MADDMFKDIPVPKVALNPAGLTAAEAGINVKRPAFRAVPGGDGSTVEIVPGSTAFVDNMPLIPENPDSKIKSAPLLEMPPKSLPAIPSEATDLTIPPELMSALAGYKQPPVTVDVTALGKSAAVVSRDVAGNLTRSK